MSTTDDTNATRRGSESNDLLGAGAEARYCYSTDEEEFYGDFDTREEALAWVEKYDGKFPSMYAGIHVTEILNRIGLTVDQFWEICDRFTDWKLFYKLVASWAQQS